MDHSRMQVDSDSGMRINTWIDHDNKTGALCLGKPTLKFICKVVKAFLLKTCIEITFIVEYKRKV